MKKVSLIYYLLIIRLEFTCCSNISQVESLYSDLFSNYNKKIFPFMNHSDTVYVGISAGIVSINNFDEITGELDVTFVLFIEWTDERLTWKPSDYGGKRSLVVEAGDVWRPRFSVVESFDGLLDIGNLSSLLRLHANGSVKWRFCKLLKIFCSVDVKYFPFDTQFCSITLVGNNYFLHELFIYVKDESVDLYRFTTNSFWNLQSAILKNSTISPNDYTAQEFPPDMEIKLTLQRRNDFFDVYIIIPVIFLGFLNNLVFVMPTSSGERTSVAMTALLSFVVYMDMVNENLPKSSDPVAYIYYYIIFLMTYSSVVIVLCIISLRIYDRPGNVPPNLKRLLHFLRFSCLKDTGKNVPHLKRKQKVQDHASKENPTSPAENDSDKKDIVNDHAMDKSLEVTWIFAGKTFDLSCFIALSIIFWTTTLGFFATIVRNSQDV